jgi:hypothetical protein
MEDNQEKRREPFNPERTPEPPQHKDPRERMDKTGDDSENDSPEKTNNKVREENPSKEKEKPKLLGESETEITDETTI